MLGSVLNVLYLSHLILPISYPIGNIFSPILHMKNWGPRLFPILFLNYMLQNVLFFFFFFKPIYPLRHPAASSRTMPRSPAAALRLSCQAWDCLPLGQRAAPAWLSSELLQLGLLLQAAVQSSWGWIYLLTISKQLCTGKFRVLTESVYS